MLVKVMRVTIYAKDGQSWHSHDIIDPSWQEVESAIRRLDKYCYPFIWLSLQKEKADDPDFSVIGGKGEYWFAGSVEGYDHRRYFNENGDPEKEVWVWESDQGSSDYEPFICRDLAIVLKATHYFCEHGKFDPMISWEDQ
jgi:hypothetical protein